MVEVKEKVRCCPHCGQELESWNPPPETWWNELLVCNNNSCGYFVDSYESIRDQGGSHRACRYAEEVDCNFRPIALVSWYPRNLREEDDDE